MNKSIPTDGINWYRVFPLKLKLGIKHKMLALNICSVNVFFQDASADLRHINVSLIHKLIYLSFFSGSLFEKNRLKKLRTMALPIYFIALDFDYSIQLSIIHV